MGAVARPAARHKPKHPDVVETGRAASSGPAFEAPPTDLADVELCLSAWRLKMAEQFDELLCLQHLHGVKRLDYQMETVLKVLRQLGGRALLADEVGLGKTVETGMLVKEMLLRSMAQRVLILVPSALVGQWAEELRDKFGVEAQTTESPALRRADAQAWARETVVVASLHWAKLENNAQVVTSAPWDLVAVDEAHHVKNRATAGWKLVNRLESRYRVLITATPVETNLEELYNLITLLTPGQLSTPADFKRRFVSAGDPLAPKNRDRLRELLSEVMIRNTRARAGLAIALPPRFAKTVIVEPTEAERALYEALVQQVRQPASPTGHVRRLRMAMEAAGSSACAALRILERGDAGDEAGTSEHSMRGLARLASAATRVKKLDALLDVLAEHRAEKAVVFSRFRATLDMIATELAARSVPFEVFHGGMTSSQKDQAVERFRNEARVLVASEVGGEGRNLQFASVLVNFDLPWNPMKIEQRIGRLHRIGQQREVHVISLCNAHSAEEQILDVLDRRIHMFELVVGEVDLILGRALRDKGFDQHVFDIYRSSRKDADVTRSFQALADDLQRARNAHDRIKALDDALFAEDFET